MKAHMSLEKDAVDRLALCREHQSIQPCASKTFSCDTSGNICVFSSIIHCPRWDSPVSIIFSYPDLRELACSVIIYLKEGSTVTPPRGQGEHVTLREKKSVTKLSLP